MKSQPNAVSRWEKQLTTLRARVSAPARRGAPAPDTSASLEEALVTCDDMLRELAGVHLECDRLGAAVRQETATWERLFQTIPVPAIVTDVAGTIVDLNTPAAAILNASVKHLAGQPLLVYADDRQAFLDLLHRLARGTDHVRAHVVLRPRERRRVAVHLAIAPLAGDHATAWIWFLTPAPGAEASRTVETRRRDEHDVRPDEPTGPSGDDAGPAENDGP